MWEYNYELYHHGVKGQRWGVRRTLEQLGYRNRVKSRMEKEHASSRKRRSKKESYDRTIEDIRNKKETRKRRIGLATTIAGLGLTAASIALPYAAPALLGSIGMKATSAAALTATAANGIRAASIVSTLTRTGSNAANRYRDNVLDDICTEYNIDSGRRSMH